MKIGAVSRHLMGVWAGRYGRLRRVSACLLRAWCGGGAERSGSVADAVTCMPLLGFHADVHRAVKQNSLIRLSEISFHVARLTA